MPGILSAIGVGVVGASARALRPFAEENGQIGDKRSTPDRIQRTDAAFNTRFDKSQQRGYVHG
jgi:hypothetical protein